MRFRHFSLLLLAAVAACDQSPAAPPDLVTGARPSPFPPPSWILAGRIAAAPDGPAVPGATVQMDGLSPFTSAGDGRFWQKTPDAAMRRATILANGFLARETFIAGNAARTDQTLDLIATDGSFPLQVYKDMVWDEWQKYWGTTQPLWHWTSPPNIYIWTRWHNNEAESVHPDAIDFLISEINRVMPQLSGGRFDTVHIETGIDNRAMRTPGWIQIQFDPAGNYGTAGSNPGLVQFTSMNRCNSLAVIHELGHAMGYWHQRAEPSVMGGGPAQCRLYDFTPDEQKVARVMYSRANGNRPPDRDPTPAALQTMPPSTGALLSCDAVLNRR